MLLPQSSNSACKHFHSNVIFFISKFIFVFKINAVGDGAKAGCGYGRNDAGVRRARRADDGQDWYVSGQQGRGRETERRGHRPYGQNRRYVGLRGATTPHYGRRGREFPDHDSAEGKFRPHARQGSHYSCANELEKN